MKKRMILPVIAIVTFLALIAASQLVETSKNYMPYVSYAGKTATPTPTVTNTPKPTHTLEPTPTATPTYQIREGANTCGVVLGAGLNPEDGGTDVGALVPGLCSFVEEYDVQQGGTVLVVSANGIKIDTWGCMEGDFGYWPPDEFDCPPVEPFFDEWGRILWGDIEITHFENSYESVCFHCEECDNETKTFNCVTVHRPNTMAELHEIIMGR